MPNSAEEGGGSSGHSGSSRKEKKKQAKEERDRLKQAEKKKRRLEKALATAAAIRSELEKKKQRRKEEEQRLNDEGARLAEAVALQVLLDEEESDGKADQDGMYSPESNESVAGERLQLRAASGENSSGSRRTSWSEWDSPVAMATTQTEDELASCRKGLIVSAEEKARVTTERARAAEMAAGLAAAQAVAALRIAEEARAEAEAAKKAAEAAVIEAHQRDNHQKCVEVAVTDEPDEDKNELKARLIETERKLMEKTKRVSELEQNLDEVTQYLLEFKAKFEGRKLEDHAAGGLTANHESVTPQVGS